MEEIKRIYNLLLHGDGLKIREIAKRLELDPHHVAVVLFSIECSSYWYQDNSSLWYAVEGAIKIEEPKQEEKHRDIALPTKWNIERILSGNDSKSLRQYLEQISKYKVYSNMEMLVLFDRYKLGDMEAFDLLYKSNLRLVVNIAKSFKRNGVDLEDIIQEGNIGLLIAIEKFNPQKNNRFVGYAQYWIIQRIKISLTTIPYLVRLPLNQIILHRKIQEEKTFLEQKYEGTPPVQDLPIYGIDEQHLSYLYELPENLVKMVSYVNDWENQYYSESTTDSKLEIESLRYDLNHCLCFLSSRERIYVSSYFGLNNKRKESINDIAQRFDMSRERIRQILVKAIKKMRILIMFKYRSSLLTEKEREYVMSRKAIIEDSLQDIYDPQKKLKDNLAATSNLRERLKEERKREAEEANQLTAEYARRLEVELEKKWEADLEKKREAEQAKRREAEQKKKREIELANKWEAEQAKRREADQAKRREAELKKRWEAEAEKIREKEQAKKRETDLIERWEDEMAKIQKAELAMKKEAEETKKQAEDETKKRQDEKIRRLEAELENLWKEKLEKKYEDESVRSKKAEFGKNIDTASVRRAAEEARRKEAEEAKRRAAESMRRRTEEARRIVVEEARRRIDEETRRIKAEETRRRNAEKARKREAEEAKRRLAEQAKRQAPLSEKGTELSKKRETKETLMELLVHGHFSGAYEYFNYVSSCAIFNKVGNKVFNELGNLRVFNDIPYHFIFDSNFFRVNTLKYKGGRFFVGKKILMVNSESELFKSLGNNYLEKINEITYIEHLDTYKIVINGIEYKQYGTPHIRKSKVTHAHTRQEKSSIVKIDTHKKEVDEKPSTRGEQKTVNSIAKKLLNKRRFVLETVKYYVWCHPQITYESLLRVFPDSLNYNRANGVIKRYDDIEKKIKYNPNTQKYFFLKDDEIIKLSDGMKIVVHNQWGDDFRKFLKVAESLFHVIYGRNGYLLDVPTLPKDGGMGNANNNRQEKPPKVDKRIGYIVRLFPSQKKGEIINIRIDRKGIKMLVVKTVNGDIVEIDDLPYLYEILKRN